MGHVQSQSDRYEFSLFQGWLNSIRLKKGSTSVYLGTLTGLVADCNAALVVAGLMGKATQLTGQHRGYQVNTIKHRFVLSAVTLCSRRRR